MKYRVQFEEMDYVLKDGYEHALDQRYSGFLGLKKATPKDKEKEKNHKYIIIKEVEASNVSELLNKIYQMYLHDNDIYKGEVGREPVSCEFYDIAGMRFVPAIQRDETGEEINPDENYFDWDDDVYYSDEGKSLRFCRVSVIVNIQEITHVSPSGISTSVTIYNCPNENTILKQEEEYLSY